MARNTANVDSLQSRQFTAVDLFSGCGGLTTGLKKAGFQIIGAVELDALAVSTYRKNHPEVHIWQLDIRRLSVSKLAQELRLHRGHLDLLAGCPPCQAFSTLRTLNRGRRIRDPKQKDLLYEVLRFVRVLRPKAVMVENVPGLVNDQRWRRFTAVLRKLGYICDYKVLNAADYGVPQRRRRLLLLGSQLGSVPFARSHNRHRTVRESIRSLKAPGRSGDPLHDVSEKRRPEIFQLIKRIPKNGGSRTDLPHGLQLECHKKCDGFKDVYGRLSWNDVAPTITGGFVNPSKGRFLHPVRHRTITLREAALLQSFPRKYFISLDEGKFRAAALIGNALPPEFIRRHANRVRWRLTVTSRKR